MTLHRLHALCVALFIVTALLCYAGDANKSRAKDSALDSANAFADSYGEWAAIINERYRKCGNNCVDARESAAFRRQEQDYKRFKLLFQSIYK